MDPVSLTPTRPRDYAALSAGYGMLLGGLVVASRSRDATPVRPAELPVLGLATFALAKLVAKEKVETWIREPFVEERVEDHGVERRPKGSGLRYAVGELLTCSRCVGSWSALGLVSLRMLRPREAGVVLPVLACAGVNDWLQSGFAALCGEADLLQQRTQAQPPEAGDDHRFTRPRRSGSAG